jgi:two-component sensor histidine kinase
VNGHPPDAGPPRVVFRLVLAGWLGLALVDIGQQVASSLASDREVDLLQTSVLTVPAYVVLAFLSPIVFRIVTVFPLRREQALRSGAAHAIAMLIFATVHLVISAAVSAELNGTMSFALLLQKWRFTYVPLNLFRYWGLVWLYQALWNARRARAGELELEQLRAQAAAARLQTLTSQLRPHFLFNSLNVISGFALKEEPERASRLIASLSDLLRRSLRQNAVVTTLGEELSFVRAYLDIEQARLGSRLRVGIDVAAELETWVVPSFLLQPLVENAVQHGVAREAAGGSIRLRGRVEGERLVLQVEDSGRGFSGTTRNGGLGLAATRARLADLYRGDAELRTENIIGGGARVTVVLPAAPPLR